MRAWQVVDDDVVRDALKDWISECVTWHDKRITEQKGHDCLRH